MPQPTVYLVAGPNGAGKTTFATEFLPSFANCKEFLNADLIAAGLSPFNPESQNLRAGRLLLERIEELATQCVDFGFETTLSGRTYAKLLSDLKARGYRTVLYFLWLPGEELAISRVANRVQQGGHNVPPLDIRRRYWAGIKNLFQLYMPLLDRWLLYDASQSPPSLIAFEAEGQVKILRQKLYQQVEQQVDAKND